MPLIPRRRISLSLVEVRVLAALVKGKLLPVLTRRVVLERTGLSTKGGSANRALNGIPANSSTGKPRPGLLALGYVEALELLADGPRGAMTLREVRYRITDAGRQALQAYIKAHGPLPPLRDPKLSRNRRYRS